MAGERFGEGVPWDTAALVLVQLGVRAVMARSLARRLRHAAGAGRGLPLAWASANEGRGVRHGDELEMPGVPETFVSGRPIVVRNLTQGSQYTLRHALGAARGRAAAPRWLARRDRRRAGADPGRSRSRAWKRRNSAARRW